MKCCDNVRVFEFAKFYNLIRARAALEREGLDGLTRAGSGIYSESRRSPEIINVLFHDVYRLKKYLSEVGVRQT